MERQKKLERVVGLEPTTLTLATWAYFKGKDCTSRYWTELERTFEREVLPTLGSRYCHTISKKDIRDLLATKDAYRAAKRTLWDGLRPFFKYLEEYDHITINPFDTLSPPPAPKARDRILTENEISRVWRATADDWYWSPYFRLLLLTGQRREEVSYAVIGPSNTLVIPSYITKTKEASVIPMTNSIAYEYNRKTYVHPSGYSKALKELHRRSGTKDWRIHDLRRTFASSLAMLGVDPWLIERLLNHRIPGVKGIYNRYSYLKEKKQALILLDNYIQTLI